MKEPSCTRCGSANIAQIKNKTAARAVNTGKTAMGLVHPTTYICKDCGFIEEYLDDKDLEKVRRKY